jgi:streptogramin lyase
MRPALAWLLLVLAAAPLRAGAESLLEGRVVDAGGAPVAGAMVTLSRGDPAQQATVFSAEDGAFRAPAPAGEGALGLRVRRIGYRDLRTAEATPSGVGTLRLERETDPAALAEQLPANHWYALVLAKIRDEVQREELVRQCTYCHQQGSWATRRLRTEDEWNKVLVLMGRMGGMVSPALRAEIPKLMNAAYDPAVAVPALTARMHEPDFAPPPPAAVRRARIDEWELGGRASMQHDLTVHPDGRIYSVDMQQDQLFRLDPETGKRESWTLPHGDLPLGGVFATMEQPVPPNTNAYVGPHSLQVAPDGSLWITLALGNQLARFDPKTEQFTTHALAWGYYPHTLRFDRKGRVWYTIAASNHLGMFDPATNESREIRLPAPTLGQEVVLRLMPAFLWLGRHVDLRGAAAERGEGANVPIPYGIDVAPDGGIWFSQLNAHRIGRMDPDTFAVEIVETPFPAPRRMRFDSQGALWIPSFSGGKLARFDLATRAFRTWDLPIEPAGSDVPYALHVDRKTDTVWICGTNSDTLIRFVPTTETFTVYPLPTRVTYTREIDFDAQGRVWTSNSNAPAWQIETGMPKVIRLDPAWQPEGAAAQRAALVVPGSPEHLRNKWLRQPLSNTQRLTKGR